MLKYIIKRLLWIIPVLFGVAIVVFTILYFSPGDPAYLALGDNATPEAVEAYRVEMGIDGTYWERLGRLLTALTDPDDAPDAVGPLPGVSYWALYWEYSSASSQP